MLLLLLLSLHSVISRDPLSIRIGGIFDLSDGVLPPTFGTSVSILNNSSSILPSTRVDFHTLYSDGDFLSTYQVICSHLQYSAFTVFSGVKLDAVVSNVLNKFHVPHLSTEMVKEVEIMERPFSLYLGPSKEDMTMAVETTVKALTRPAEIVALITHETGILLTSSLLTKLQKNRLDVIVEDLVEKDIRPILVRIRKMNIKTIIVDVAADLVKPFIYQALQSGLLHSQATLIFTPLDFPHLGSVMHAQLTGATMLGYSLLAETPGEGEEERTDYQSLSSLVQTDYRSILLHDSVLLFGYSLSSLSSSSDPETERLNCSSPDSVSTQGDQMLSHLHSARLEGLTGGISFTAGRRDNLQIQLVRRGEEGELRRVGVFSTGSRELKIEKYFTEEREIRGGEKVEIHVMECSENVTNIHKFLIDVLENVSNTLNIEIELKQHFGHPSFSTIRMKKLLQDGHLLLLDAATLLTLGEDVAALSPVQTNPEPFPAKETTRISLLPPFPWLTWLGLLLSLLLTSITLSLLSKLSPTQRSHYPLSLLDSLWCVSSALFLSLQHSKLKAVSTRLLIIGWSLFCVSSLLSYLLSPLSNSSGSIHAQSLMYLAGSGQTEHLVQGVTTVLVQRQARQVTGTTQERTDLLYTIHTSFLFLFFLLISSLVVSLCELVVFSWYNRGSQTVWSALLREMIKTAAKTRTGGDKTDSGGRSERQVETDRVNGQEQKLLGQQEENDAEGQMTRL